MHTLIFYIFAIVITGIVLFFAVFFFLLLFYTVTAKPRKDSLQNKKPYIIGHRGIPVLEHENTLESFKLLQLYNVSGTEFDVTLTKDDMPVVFHDASLTYMFGDKRKISELYFKELQEYRFKSFLSNNNNYQLLKVPTLDETLEYLSQFEIINCEIKSNGYHTNTLIRKTAECIKKYSLEKKIIVSSFNPFVLNKFAAILPNVTRGYLLNNKNNTIPLLFVPFAKADLIHFHSDFISNAIVKRFTKSGYGIVFWGINNRNILDQTIKYNPKIIITDIPHILQGYTEGAYI